MKKTITRHGFLVIVGVIVLSVSACSYRQRADANKAPAAQQPPGVPGGVPEVGLQKKTGSQHSGSGVYTNYLQVSGTTSLRVEDEMGNNNEAINDLFANQVPGVDIHSQGSDSTMLVMTIGKTYTITFITGEEPLEIELIKGETNTAPVEVIRYLDVLLPSGMKAELRVTPEGMEDLRYDADGDGSYETRVAPTVAAGLPLAGDQEAPELTFGVAKQGNLATVTIYGTDNLAGVKEVRYSFDGRNFQDYSTPFTVNLSQYQTAYAFADDKVANRSRLFEYSLRKK